MSPHGISTEDWCFRHNASVRLSCRVAQRTDCVQVLPADLQPFPVEACTAVGWLVAAVAKLPNDGVRRQALAFARDKFALGDS